MLLSCLFGFFSFNFPPARRGKRSLTVNQTGKHFSFIYLFIFSNPDDTRARTSAPIRPEDLVLRSLDCTSKPVWLPASRMTIIKGVVTSVRVMAGTGDECG